MARDETARDSVEDESLLDRRRYLKLAGATAASVASFGTSGAAQDDTLLVDVGFEDTSYRNLYTGGTVDWKTETYEKLVSNPVKSGSSALKIRFPEGNHDGRGAWVDPVEAGLLDQPTRELHASYWVYFPDKFQCSGGKLPGPINYFEDWSETDGNGDGHGGQPSDGYGWSARGKFNDSDDSRVEIGSYVYHMDMDRTYGDNWGMTWVSKGEWHRVTQRVKLNTTSGGTANPDGVLEWWIDGEKVIDRHDMRWTNHPDHGVKYGLTVWYGGNQTSPIDQGVYFDNWKLDTEPISGTAPAGSTSTTTSETTTDSGGTVFELVADDGIATTSYQFTVDGTVTKRLDAGSVSAEQSPQDAITDNGDGTVTVQGAAGNGYGDSYVVDGTITSIDLDETKWTLRYGGTETTVSELTASSTTLPNLIIIDGTNRPGVASDYEFSVSGDVSKDEEHASVNGYDTVSGSTATGRIIGGKDAYRFSGEIKTFSLDGPALVTVREDV